VPYMAGDITQTKRGTVIVLVVLVLITIVSIVRMTVLNDLNTKEENTFLMRVFLYLNECNQLIEWASITLLYFLMGAKNGGLLINKAPDEDAKEDQKP